MEFLIPTWLFTSILIGYFILLVLLSVRLVRIGKLFSTGQLILLVGTLWFIPVAGPIIVMVKSFRKVKLR